MRNRIFKLSVTLILILLSNKVYSQFYDSEDKIMFYKCELLDGVVNESSTNNLAKVFNFDGNKATDFYNDATSAPTVKNKLKSNKYFFENKVYESKYDLKYRSDLSNSSWVVYSVYRSGSSWVRPWTDFYFFSHDRKTMIYKASSYNTEWTYKLVDKSYFIEEGRRRSNIKDERIYE